MISAENYDFQTAIRPMYIVGRILGVTHYSVSGSAWRRKYTVTKTDTVLAITHALIMFIATKFQAEILIMSTQNMSFVKKTLSLLMGFFPAIIAWSNMLCFYCWKDKYFLVMYKLSDVHEKLKVFNVNSLNQTRRFVYQTLCCAYFMFGLSTFLYLYIQVTMSDSVFYPALNCSMYTIQLALECEKIIFLNELRLQFRNIRVCFENINTDIIAGREPCNEKNIIGKLKILENLYSTVYGIGKDIDRIFSIQIQTKLVTSFMSTCSTLFYLPTVYETVAPMSFINVLMWLQLNILELFVILLMFSSVEFEADQVHREMCKIKWSLSSPSINRVISNILLRTVHQSAMFTANGFLKLDLSFMASYIASSVTYTVVLLQFDNVV